VKKQTTYCDICERIIEYPGRNGMIEPYGLSASQVWATSGGDRDVCGFCISVLLVAKTLGMIQIDMTQFYERAGYTWDGEYWQVPVITITEEELLSAIKDAEKGEVMR
jgi:hypothetical protein